MAEPAEHTISVVIVAWNSSEELAATIPAVLRELADGDELVVVDNASSDGTAEAVARLAPDAVLVRESENLGFAEGINRGAAAASGELLVLLNPDAVPRPGFREGIVRPLADGRGWAAWQGLVTAENGAVLNTAGGVLHFTGVAWAGGAGEPVPASLEPHEVPFLSGACLAVPRETFLRTGGFDGDYFMYHEDVDVSLRLRLEGGTVGLEPSAVVDHDYEFSATPAKYRYLERNRWSTVLRTYPGPLLAAVMPAMIATELALVVVAASEGWARLKVAAWGDTLRGLRGTLRERRAIQSGRRITAGEFAAFLTPDLDSPYLGRAGRIAPLRWALRAYWVVARALVS